VGHESVIEVDPEGREKKKRAPQKQRRRTGKSQVKEAPPRNMGASTGKVCAMERFVVLREKTTESDLRGPSRHTAKKAIIMEGKTHEGGNWEKQI